MKRKTENSIWTEDLFSNHKLAQLIKVAYNN